MAEPTPAAEEPRLVLAWEVTSSHERRFTDTQWRDFVDSISDTGDPLDPLNLDEVYEHIDARGSRVVEALGDNLQRTWLDTSDIEPTDLRRETPEEQARG